MANKKFTYDIGFNVDDSSLNKVKAEFQSFKNMTANDYIKIRPELDLGEAISEVTELKQSINSIENAFAKSFNVNLGSTNVVTLKRELDNLDLNKISKQFSNLGSHGVRAWQAITSSVLGMNLQLQKSETILDKMATTMGNTIKWGISSSAMNSFTGAVQKAHGYVQKLDKSLNNIRIVSNQSASQMAEFAVQANKAASALGATTLDYTNASLIFYQQGLKGEDVTDRADAVVKMTNVTGDAADKVSSYMTAIWNNFADGSKHLEYYADVMTALGAATASSTAEIADGLEKFASVADTVGLSYEYATASLATVVAETRQSADVVGTAFRTLFARIQGLSLGETLDDGTDLNKYSKALEAVGVDIKEQNGELKAMDDILDELGTKWKNLSADTKVALAQTVAGTRQYSQMVALMDNWDKVQENLVVAADSTGTLQKQQDIYMDSLEGHLNKLETAQQALYDSMFDSDSFKDLLDIVTGLVDGLTDFVDAIGGGGNALMLLGTIATKVFDKQIARGLTNIINNSKLASNNMARLQAQQAILEKVNAGTEGRTDIVSKASHEGTSAATEQHSRMMDYTDVLSEESINNGNELIKVYSDLIAKTEELKLKQEEAAQIMQQVLSTQDPETYGSTSKEDFQEDIGEGSVSLSTIGDFSAQIKTLKDETDTLAKSARKTFTTFTTSTEEASGSEEELENQVTNLQSELKKIKPILSKDLQERFEKLEEINIDYNSKDFEKNCSQIISIGENAFQELSNKGALVDDALSNASNSAISNVSSQAEAAKQDLDSFFSNLDLTSTIKSVTDVVSSMGSLYTAIQAVKGLGQIWSDDDLSLGEKFAQTLFLTTTLLTNIGPVITTVQGAYKALTLVKAAYDVLQDKEIAKTTAQTILDGKSAAAKLAKNIIMKAEKKAILEKTAAEGAETVATGANTIATMANNVAKAIGKALLGDGSGLALVAAGAVVIGTMALIANTAAQNKDNEAKERANKTTSDLTSVNEELNESYDNLKSSFDTYDTAVDKLKDCVKGTQEWKDALNEVNKSALEVINNLPENVNVEGLYNRNQDGMIEIDQDRMEGILDQSKLQAASSDLAVAANSYTNTMKSIENSTNKVGDSISDTTLSAADMLDGAIWKWATDLESDAIGKSIRDNLDKFSEDMTPKEFSEQLKELGVDISQLSNDELEEYRTKVLECANASNAAAEKLRLVAGLKVDEVLGDDYDATEKTIVSEQIVNEQQDIYDQIMKDQADKMAKSSNANNEYYQELASRLEAATGGKYKVTTGNTVRHTDKNRTLVFEDENGEQTEEKSIEWVAQTIAAYEAMEKVGTSAEQAKESLDSLEMSLGDEFGKETGERLSNGIKSFITSGNLESLSEEDFNKIADMDKGELAKAMGVKLSEVDDMLGEYDFKDFKQATKDYKTALDDFTKNLLSEVQDAFSGLDNLKGLNVTGQKAIAQALEDAMVYGGEEALESMTNMFSQMSTEDLKNFNDVAGAVGDWGTVTVDELKKNLEEAGVKTEFTTDELENYIDTMRQAANATKDFNTLSSQYAEVMKIAGKLKTGDTISQDDYDKLGSAAEGYFTKMLDGTYKLTKDASDFYDAIKENQVDKFKNSLQDSKNNLDNLKNVKNANYDLQNLSKEQGANHKFNDALYDMGTALTINNVDRDTLSEQQKKDKNLTWKDSEGIQAQIDLLKALGDTEQALKWEEKIDSLSNKDYEEIANGVKQIADTYGDLDTAIATASNTYREDWLALLTSASDLDEMRSLTDFSDETSVSAFTEAYSQMRESMRMDDIDVDKMEDYAKHLQEISDSSKTLSTDLKNDEEASEDLAIQIMNMSKGVEKLADGWEDWSDILKKSSKESEEYFEAISEVKDAMSDLLDIDKDFISSDLITNNMEDIGKAAKGDADAIDRLRAAALQDIVLNMELEDGALQGQELWSRVQELQSLLDEMGPITAGTKIDLAGLDASETEFIDKLNAMILEAGMSADQVNAMLSGMGFSTTFSKEPQQITTKVPLYETKHSIVPGTEMEIPDGNGGTRKIQGWSEYTETNQVGEKTYTTEGEAFAMQTSEPGTTVVPKIESVSKKASGSFNNYSSTNKGGGGPGKSSGGSKSKPKKEDKMEGEKDRYHDVDVKLKLIDNDLQKLQKSTDKLIGKAKIDNINKQLKLLDKQLDVTNEKMKIAYGEQSELQNKLAQSGVKFNADGTMANYAQAYDAQLAYVNSVIDRYNSMDAEGQESFQETLDKAKENFDKFVEDMERYDELVTDFIPGLKSDIEDALYEEIELKIQKFDMEIEIRLDLKDAELEWNEFKRKIIDGIKDEDILGMQKKNFTDLSAYYKDDGTGIIQSQTTRVNSILTEMAKMDRGELSSVYSAIDEKSGTVVNDRAAALEALKEAYTGLMGNLEEFADKQEEIRQAYLDMMDEAQEKFDEQIENFEAIDSIINHDMNLISLVYGDKSYQALAGYYDKMEENNNKQLDFQRQQVEFWKQQMDNAEEGSEAWQKAKENWMSAVDELNSKIESSVENLQDKYLNAINLIFQNLDNKITNGMGLDYVSEQWDLINKKSDQYLDTVNATYEVQKLENKYLDALDKTDGISSQRKLKKVMDEQLKQLREKDQLSEYDVERANKMYEIALKQIALEEAQQNKSTMRLRRDSQGNYSYQFVSDNDEVQKAEDELNDAYNSLYNFDKDNYQENLNEAFDLYQEFRDKMLEAAEIRDDAERERLQDLYKNYYGELINNTLAENLVIRDNLESSAFADLAAMYVTNSDNFKAMTDYDTELFAGMTNLTDAYFQNFLTHSDEGFKGLSTTMQEEIMTNLVPSWGSGVQGMIDSFTAEGGFLPTCQDAFTQLDTATNNYKESLNTLQTSAGTNFGEIKQGIDANYSSTKDLTTESDKLFKTYSDNINTIKSVITQMNNLIAKYDAAAASAKKAATEAYNYRMELERKNAAEAAAENAKNNSSGGGGGNTGNSGNSGGGSTGGGDGNLSVGEMVTFTGGKYYGDSYGGGGSGSRGPGKKVRVTQIANGRPYPIHVTSSDSAYGWLKKEQLAGYDTGGYTGEWGSDGRLAMLHQKELVLNANDTENMLNAIEILRTITDTIGNQMLSKLSTMNAVAASGIDKDNDVLEQNVHIEAVFPNVTNSHEIEDAINNLNNVASQRIGRRR